MIKIKAPALKVYKHYIKDLLNQKCGKPADYDSAAKLLMK